MRRLFVPAVRQPQLGCEVSVCKYCLVESVSRLCARFECQLLWKHCGWAAIAPSPLISNGPFLGISPEVKEGSMLAWSWFVSPIASVNSLIPLLQPIAVAICGVAAWTALLYMTWFLARALRGMRRRVMKRRQHLIRCARCRYLFAEQYNCYLNSTIPSQVAFNRSTYRSFRRTCTDMSLTRPSNATNLLVKPGKRK